jgi:hypothetical protein
VYVVPECGAVRGFVVSAVQRQLRPPAHSNLLQEGHQANGDSMRVLADVAAAAKRNRAGSLDIPQDGNGNALVSTPVVVMSCHAINEYEVF